VGDERVSFTRVTLVILSDRTLREEIAAGRILIDPFDANLIQAVLDRRQGRHLFRVFRNHTTGIIDVKQDLEDLTS